jgi:RNA polymerase sigma factor (sigma-70 family)
MNERTIVRDCLGRVPGSWDRFIGAFEPVVRAAVGRVLGRGPSEPTDMDDLVQEVFLSLLQEDCRLLREFQWRSSLRTWLSVVAASKAVDLLRRRRPLARLSEAPAPAPVPEGADPDRVRRTLECMGARDRLLLELVHRRGQSYRQVAGLLGVRENSVGPALSRAEQRFKECLSQMAG